MEEKRKFSKNQITIMDEITQNYSKYGTKAPVLSNCELSLEHIFKNCIFNSKQKIKNLKEYPGFVYNPYTSYEELVNSIDYRVRSAFYKVPLAKNLDSSSFEIGSEEVKNLKINKW